MENQVDVAAAQKIGLSMHYFLASSESRMRLYLSCLCLSRCSFICGRAEDRTLSSQDTGILQLLLMDVCVYAGHKVEAVKMDCALTPSDACVLSGSEDGES